MPRRHSSMAVLQPASIKLSLILEQANNLDQELLFFTNYLNSLIMLYKHSMSIIIKLAMSLPLKPTTI